MSGDIKERLAKAGSILSLSAEEDVRTRLESLGWDAVHSAYYKDVATAKLRELDVVGKKTWWKSGDKGTSVRIFILVECKSMDGYHLVFSQSRPRWLQFQVSGLCSWHGYLHYAERRAIANALSEFNYDQKELTAVFTEIERIAYPDDTVRVFDLIVKPFPESMSATAYRETNVNSEKELDNSVLWRSMQELYSAVRSLKEESRDGWIGDLSVNAMLAERDDSDRIEALREPIDRGTRHIDLYHPVVLVNANLWARSPTAVESINWCRFYQHDAYGEVERWCDIVNTQYAQEYFAALTAHYTTCASEAVTK